MVSSKKGNLIFNIIGAILAIFWVFPFYIMIVSSFKPQREIFESTLALPQNFTLDNYIRAFHALNFPSALANSLIITVSTVIIVLVFSSMASYALQRTKTKVSNAIFFVLISSMLIPFQAVMIPLVSFMSTLGLIGHRPGLVFMYLGFNASMAIFLITGTLQSIPTSLDEAANIDGCNPFQTFFIIILPLLKPILVTVAILNSIAVWNDFLLPSLTINIRSLETIPMRIFLLFAQYTRQWDLAMAGLTLSIIPIIIFYFIAQKQILEGMTQGAIKQ
jgi:raffinose/stachyose/melibiose transport system permease protein